MNTNNRLLEKLQIENNGNIENYYTSCNGTTLTFKASKGYLASNNNKYVWLKNLQAASLITIRYQTHTAFFMFDQGGFQMISSQRLNPGQGLVCLKYGKHKKNNISLMAETELILEYIDSNEEDIIITILGPWTQDIYANNKSNLPVLEVPSNLDLTGYTFEEIQSYSFNQNSRHAFIGYGKDIPGDITNQNHTIFIQTSTN